ncbi:MAG: divergent polysaccharide deacetylase family protein, partial [Gammaproteobacteria bacterium]
MAHRHARWCAALVLWCACATSAIAAQPVVAIIMDDLGNGFEQTTDALRLPGRITYSFLPHAPHSAQLAALANRRGKEVMLHLPMEAVSDWPLGPGGLTLDMTEAAFKTSVTHTLHAVPAASGINNHMGSLLTRHPGHMGWLMEAIRDYSAPLYFVDSKTTGGSVAYRMAREHGVPALRRDVFLDSPDSGAAYVRERLTEMVR